MWKYGITNVKFNRQQTHLIRMVRIKMVPRNVRQLHHGLPTHYTHATWSSRRLKSLASRLFTQEFAQANTKRISNHWPFVMGFHRWPIYSPYKRAVIRKTFPYDDVIMKLLLRLPVWFLVADYGRRKTSKLCKLGLIFSGSSLWILWP